jgi:rRNA-processing protein FCF1
MAKGKKVVLPDLGSFLKIRRMDIAQFYQSLNGKSFDDRVEEAKKKFSVTQDIVAELKEASKAVKKAFEDKVVIVEDLEENADKPEKKKKKKDFEEAVSEQVEEKTSEDN